MLTRSNKALIIVVLCCLYVITVLGIRVGTEQQGRIVAEEQLEDIDLIIQHYKAKSNCDWVTIPTVEFKPSPTDEVL